MEAFSDSIAALHEFLTDGVIVVLILAVGIYFTVRLKCIQLRHLGKACVYIFKGEEGESGEVTSFGALCTALSATLGTGNIVGVATALCIGGPGALVWMFVSALFSMATKYAEGLLAVKFRVVSPNGHFFGGPFYYIERGMGKRFIWLAKLFALFGALAGIMGIGTITQASGIVSAIQGFFDPEGADVLFKIGSHACTRSAVLSGLVVTVCAAPIIAGGIKRIAKTSEIIAPFMAIMYMVFALVILISRADRIPAAVTLALKCAVAPKAALGSGCGITVGLAMRAGVGRGIFSNEAGLGSAPIAAAAARTKEPVRQGLVTMMGTFIDTVVICTVTGLCILVTDAHTLYSKDVFEGINITTAAWRLGLPWSEGVSSFLLMACLIFFAFSTIVGWNYYSEKCVEYLTKSNPYALKLYRWLYIAAVFSAPYISASTVWSIADLSNALMAIPNLIALFALRSEVKKETERFFFWE